MYLKQLIDVQFKIKYAKNDNNQHKGLKNVKKKTPIRFIHTVIATFSGCLMIYNIFSNKVRNIYPINKHHDTLDFVKRDALKKLSSRKGIYFIFFFNYVESCTRLQVTQKKLIHFRCSPCTYPHLMQTYAHLLSIGMRIMHVNEILMNTLLFF